ncbi:MAG: DUF177 domain-containing protein [Alphaproteobacteria bacterium]|nr:DUF177 domain-containing protein [Alphaproteobacteria bacterium]MBO4643940.1 DUF177 domain-containing protein [Alphaproteobacteria bacterium]
MKEISPEFSYMVDVNRIPTSGLSLNLQANEEQKSALAKRFGLEEIRSLTAEMTFKRINKKRVRVDARFNAEVKQICVVTLEPFNQSVKDEFSVVFSQEDDVSLRLNEIDMDMNEDDDVEFLQSDKIDAGELIAEYLSLSLDPFPHAPNAKFESESDAETEKNAFSVLEKLKFK